jgi:serine/threonine protein kinase
VSLETYGRYQLLKKLATGGMAQIYLARQLGPEGFEKLLVVKRILPHLAENEEFVTMFLDEARIAARLNHPNVVQIFDLGAQDDSFFIAMEFIHGEDIRRVWKHADKIGKPIPLALICRMIIDACAGLDYAHKKADQSGRPLNIVHRDISPQNILVSFEGGVKVVDFGIAKAADQATVTKSGVLKGKYSYMSPEQAAGQAIDNRTDIFALGVLLYELLTGTRLFKRATDIQTLNAVGECKVAPPSEINDRVPPELDAIVMKALTKDRHQRFAEARHLGAALEEWVLSNQLPSSAAALGEFMRDIYAERLTQEAEEGRLLIETAESAASQDLADRALATPSLEKVPRQTKSMRSGRSNKSLEETRAQALSARSQSNSKRKVDLAPEASARPVPQVSGSERHTEASMPTQSEGRGKGPLVAMAAVLALMVAGVAGYAIFGRAKTGSFSIDSVPTGAKLSDATGELCTTPCTRDDLPPGELVLTLTRDGFKPEKRTVLVRAGVHESLSSVALQPVEVQPVAAADAGVPAVVQPEMMLVKFVSEPPGAELTLDGEAIGMAPLTRALASGRVFELKAELKGYTGSVETVQVLEQPEQEHLVTLKPNGRVKNPILKPPEVKSTPLSTAARGTVRFVVKPWAVVECPQARFKDTTPFADQQLPVGDYSCTFTNPDFPAQTKVLHVEADRTIKVSVTFQ